MNWLFYIGGGAWWCALSVELMLKLYKREAVNGCFGGFMFTFSILIWIWICWRFVK